EQLKATADNIYDLPANAPFHDQLGTGRLNMSTALDSIAGPAVEMENIDITDHEDEIYLPGEEISVAIELVNYLGSTGALNVEMGSLTPNIEVMSGSWQVPALGEFERRNNYSAPFLVRVVGSGEENEEAILKFTISDGGYTTRK